MKDPSLSDFRQSSYPHPSVCFQPEVPDRSDVSPGAPHLCNRYSRLRSARPSPQMRWRCLQQAALPPDRQPLRSGSRPSWTEFSFSSRKRLLRSGTQSQGAHRQPGKLHPGRPLLSQSIFPPQSHCLLSSLMLYYLMPRYLTFRYPLPRCLTPRRLIPRCPMMRCPALPPPAGFHPFPDFPPQQIKSERSLPE